MTDYQDDSMDALAGKTARATDAELSDRELQLLLNTSPKKLLSLESKMTDKETYAKLIALVKESARKNDKLAGFKTKVLALGPKVPGLIKKVIGFLS